MYTFVLTRREWLRMSGAASAGRLLGVSVTMRNQTLVPAERAIDHLLLGVADLNQGISWVEKMTGVRPIPGGSHPGRGTRNALISLGAKQYLEIIAPDPLQSAYNFQIDVRNLTEPKLITWAALTTDVNVVAGNARKAGYQIFGPRDGSRARTDGKLLKWKSLGVSSNFGLQGVDPIPFFIEWASDSVHPSQDSPGGCQLQSFEMQHADPAGVIETLKNLGIDMKAKRAKEARLVVTLKTPKGIVELS